MNKNKIIVACSILLIIILSVFVYMHYHNNKASDVKQVTSETKTVLPSDVQTAFSINGKTVSESDAKDLSRQINRVSKKELPAYHSITIEKESADNKANEIAKENKADAVINQKSKNEKESNDKADVYDNNYYIVSSERKHDIKAGCAYVDNSAYATVSYRNRQVEYTAMYNPSTKQAGAMVQVTVAKW
jgi:hypothetical protein